MKAVGLLAIFLGACSGGGNGSTDYTIRPTGTFTTIGSTLEDETMMVSYTPLPVDDEAITMIPANYF